MKKIELMAPAGSFDAMQAALDAGADSIYFGIDQLNMRARASINFTLENLPEIVQRCEAKNVRTYLTLNTIIYDHDLSLIKRLIKAVKDSGVSAIIASDQAVIGYASSVGVKVHISTQLNVTNIETVRFYSHFADVMVLSRELSLRQVKAIVDGIKKENITGPSGRLIEIEIFGHGALCMAVSGKCYLSLHTQNASANRGACIQNCRRTYTVIDKEDGHEFEIDNEFIMSPKDLCTLDFLDQVIDTGIKVLKIEGRGRAPEYVKETISCYREAIDAYEEDNYTQKKIKSLMNRLSKVYNRGFWAGYYLGQKLGEWHDTHGSKATEKKIYLGKGVHYYTKLGIAEFKIESHSLKVGERILVTGSTTGAQKTHIKELRVKRENVDEVKKGVHFSIPLDFKIRASDKLYKIVNA